MLQTFLPHAFPPFKLKYAGNKVRAVYSKEVFPANTAALGKSICGTKGLATALPSKLSQHTMRNKANIKPIT